MLSSGFKLLAFIGTLSGALIARAAELEPGSAAPPLSVKTWYKGTPVREFKRNKIYVVEFWATWCGPCRRSIPHVTELAKKFKDVTFIGVGVREDDDGKNIKKFVAEMGEKMNYNVGYSGNKTGMYLSWMKATGQTFIPNAYIVKNGTILWIGHPLDMDQPLAEIKSGKFNVLTAKTKFHDAKVRTKLDADIDAARSEIYTLVQASKENEAKVKIDQLVAMYPTAKVDDLQKYLQTHGLSIRLAKIFEQIKVQKFNEAKVMLADLKQLYPTYKTEPYEFIILAATDHDAWSKKLKELVAKNDDESLEIAMGAMFQIGGAEGLTPQAPEIVDAILNGLQKEDFLKQWGLTLYYRAAKDYKKSLSYLDSAVASYPNSSRKSEPSWAEAFKSIRSELVKKSTATDFMLLASTDHEAWTKQLKELIAKNDQEGFEIVVAAMFKPSQPIEPAPLGKEIADAIQATIQKNDFMKYWILALYFQASKDFKQSLACVDNAITAFPISTNNKESSLLQSATKLRSELIEKLKG